MAALPCLFLAWQGYVSGGWFSGLILVFYLLLALLILLGWGLAWAIHALWPRRRRRNPNGPPA